MFFGIVRWYSLSLYSNGHWNILVIGTDIVLLLPNMRSSALCYTFLKNYDLGKAVGVSHCSKIMMLKTDFVPILNRNIITS